MGSWRVESAAPTSTGSIRRASPGAVAFGLLHHRPLAGIAAGLAYGMIYRRRGAIADAALAHAATNAALVLVAALTGRWDLWT